MDKKLFIYGAGGAGKSVCQIAKDYYQNYLLTGFLDDDQNLKGKSYFGLPVKTEYKLKEKDYVSIAIGTANVRFIVFNKLEKAGFNNFLSIIHPNALINEKVKLGRGVVIYPGVLFDPDVDVFDNVLINKGVSIGHDVKIGASTVLSPNCSIGGNVIIGEQTFIGMTAAIIQGVKIGNNCIIGMGSVVLRDIPCNSVVVGNPAKVIRTVSSYFD